MKPKIGIVGWKTGDNSFGATVPYMEYLTSYGDVHIITPSMDTRTDLDLLVLPGGQDAFCMTYKEVPSYYNSNPDLMKEFFFHNNLREYINEEIPVFGICLGMQYLNLFYGGGIEQNCYHNYSSSRTSPAHEVELTEKYKHLLDKFGYKKKEAYTVNSLHHQGINLNQMAPEFNPVAIGPYEIVEAFIHQTLPIAGVQWHPEELVDPLADYMIQHLLDTVKATKKLQVV